ncbi:hypothetical protein D7N80_25745 [Salmonella enterica subsp. enterica]|uniref:Uncharacterized protein n=1 Tax=Salmonella enterica I TaxID=59201 RepID=A0A403QP18_SALET|nr:hypothetical protein [Salmonella enterica subsp. enterica serovar Kidderminster]
MQQKTQCDPDESRRGEAPNPAPSGAETAQAQKACRPGRNGPAGYIGQATINITEPPYTGPYTAVWEEADREISSYP